MEEQTNIIPRNPMSGGALEVISLPPFLPGSQTTRIPHLRDYLIILRKHLWLILSFLLTIVTIVTIGVFKMQPVYEATTRLVIERENANILPFQEGTPSDFYIDVENYIETQAKILQSETLALQTIKSTHLTNHPEFGGQQNKKASVSTTAGGNGSIERPPNLGAFLGRLSVKRVPNTRLLDVKFESTDPQLAARVVNAHIENYIEQNFRSKFEAATAASKWMTSQLNELKMKVEKSEEARLSYERQSQIWTIDEKQNITTQKLSDLNKELTQAQAERMQKEANYESARTGNIDAVPAVRDSIVIQDLIKKQSDLRAQYSEALNQYGPNYPKVLRLQAQLRELEETVAHEKSIVVNRLESEYHAARQREMLLSQALDKQKAEANQLAEKLVQFNILKREAETNKQLYDGLLQKLKVAGIAAGLRSSNIRVVDPALVPSAPSRPQKTRTILLAALMGLVGGLGLAFLREYLDNTVKTPEEVELLTRLPSLAVVPAFSTLNGRSRMGKLLKSSPPSGSETRVELVSHTMPQSQISEAFRALRTSLLLSRAEHPPQVILVTSALPREGKTTVAANLAVTLAQLGDRTLLIDADLRKPGITRALNLTDGNYAGLSSYLAGVSSLELVTIPHPLITNLAAILAGPIPPNPADLLSSRRLSDAISLLRKDYKFIVIDSPPIIAATDAVILSALADGALLVVRSGETPKEALARAQELLAAVKSRLLGVLLNAVDSNSTDYYYSYRYYPYHSGEKERHLESSSGS